MVIVLVFAHETRDASESGPLKDGVRTFHHVTRRSFRKFGRHSIVDKVIEVRNYCAVLIVPIVREIEYFKVSRDNSKI